MNAATHMTNAEPLCDFDPESDMQEFRRSLSQFATGITVITTQAEAGPVALTANSFSSVSLAPPLILWSLARTSSRYKYFDAARTFAVNVLAEPQTALSRHFATAGADRFAGVAWEAGSNGAPVLHGVAAVFECTRESEHDGGDHRIILGRVTRAARFDRAPLLFSQGAYRVQADHPGDKARDAASLVDDSAVAREGSSLQALFRANHRLSAAFAQYRGSLTRDEHRVLISVEAKPGVTRAQVAEHSFLGVHAVDDAVNSLLGQGLLACDAYGGMSLTMAGLARRRELIGHLREMEQRVFAGIPAQTLEAGRAFLQHLAAD